MFIGSGDDDLRCVECSSVIMIPSELASIPSGVDDLMGETFVPLMNESRTSS